MGSGAEFTSAAILGSGLLQVSTFEAPIAGDFNADGVVNEADMQAWEADFGLNGDSDADGDGDSDGGDFLAWQQNYGAGSNPLAASHAIPEPSTAALLIAAISLAFRRR